MQVEVAADGLTVVLDKRAVGERMAEFLEQRLWLPHGFAIGLIRSGKVLYGTTPADLGTEITGLKKVRLQGGVVEPFGVTLDDDVCPHRADILYEDDHLLVVNKPADCLVYPGTAEDRCTLAHLIARHYQELGLERRVRHVHRLDKDTTGTVIYAKHAYSARALDSQLAAHRIHRTYWALVHGIPQSARGRISLAIGRDRHVSGRYRVSPTGKPAVTNYLVLESARLGSNWMSLVECTLETGRTHQIRVHLAAIGCPIVGDPLYGGPSIAGSTEWDGGGQALHAINVSFAHPYLMEQVDVSAPLPAALQDTLQRLKFSGHFSVR